MSEHEAAGRRGENGSLMIGWAEEVDPEGSKEDGGQEVLSGSPCRLEPGQRVLVLGCGNEPAIFQFPQRVELYWVDLLRPYLYLARTQLRSAGIVSARPAELPFKRVFDVVICPPSCIARLNVSDCIQVMNGAQRLLKDGGRLIIEFPSREILAASPPKRQAQRFGDVIVLEETRLEPSSTRLLIKKTYFERMGGSHRVECEVHAHTAKFMIQLLEKLGLDIIVQEKGALDPTLPCQRLVARRRPAQEKSGDFSHKMSALAS